VDSEKTSEEAPPAEVAAAAAEEAQWPRESLISVSCENCTALVVSQGRSPACLPTAVCLAIRSSERKSLLYFGTVTTRAAAAAAKKDGGVSIRKGSNDQGKKKKLLLGITAGNH
jgi:hypothetical protein